MIFCSVRVHVFLMRLYKYHCIKKEPECFIFIVLPSIWDAKNNSIDFNNENDFLLSL